MDRVVAVVGATGVVGREMLSTLARRGFPASKVLALASHRSLGKRLPYLGGELEVIHAEPSAFRGVTFALFSAGAAASRELAPAAAAAGAIVDRQLPARGEWTRRSRWWCPRSTTPRACDRHTGIIANPNCSTIQMVVALKPLHDRAAGLRRVVVSTYQSASGKGHAAVDELLRRRQSASPSSTSLRAQSPPLPRAASRRRAPPDSIASKTTATPSEEHKMVRTRRARSWSDPTIGVCATTRARACLHRPQRCQRPPCEFERGRCTHRRGQTKLMRHAPGALLVDVRRTQPGRLHPPAASTAAGRDERLRRPRAPTISPCQPALNDVGRRRQPAQGRRD
jgi:hypothetical protein